MAPEPPEVSIEPAGYKRTAEPGRWRVSWRLRNLDDEPLYLIDAKSPHHDFRSEETPLAVVLPPTGSSIIELLVAHEKQAPNVIDNAFLIVRMSRDGQEWRAFYRLLVTFGADGEPKNSGQVTGVHPVGFSETA